jgi:hypothetical protein
LNVFSKESGNKGVSANRRPGHPAPVRLSLLKSINGTKLKKVDVENTSGLSRLQACSVFAALALHKSVG